MKILMLTLFFYPHLGGVETHVKRVSEELIKKGHQVRILTLKFEDDLPDQENLNQMEICRLPKVGKFKTWLWLFKHRDLILDSHIIHCHDFYPFLRNYLPFRFLYPRKPVFITFHGYEGYPLPKKAIYYRKIAERLTWGNICVGEFIKKWYGTKPDFVTYGGVDVPGEPRAESREPKVFVLNTKHQTLNILFIGRLEPDTGITVYLEALAELKEKHKMKIELNVCGEGSQREEAEKIAKERGLKVYFRGWVENVSQLIARNAFVFASSYLSILEAMAHQRLVFALYTDPVKKDYLELFPNSQNLLVISRNSEELANQIYQYITYPDLIREKVSSAYQFARDQTWEKVADLYLNLWSC